MIGYIIAMLFFVSFIGSIVSISIFIADLTVNKHLSEKGLLFFLLLGVILNIIAIMIYPIGVDYGVLKK
ncbi:hypothetical protein V062_02560 [Staphylococcus aureus R0357]|uniref:hypothetical protein n=1 Tax=Staphylococcus aureus TaxID=1280 RepID=UPI000451E30D|nr:hypothetical protein [Staphylococcus aureus]EZY61409.1 hypothetical protein V060_02252 [Staphylococcus aureus R0294]EZY64253.1 hypothetical protein V062_02560 [Staphylococcus aureus R0357]EZY68596.1 hypothetical protein V064_02652 [Staphylococcus aureus R0545]EZY69242.1 hypothetical protein V063_02537 [Staphylococcus aureus R0487]EZY69832.1 hypothetical protein V065_02733 [Staphylococcus aureus R0611]